MARAAQRVEAERAAKVARRQGITPVVDSLTELANLAGEIVAMKDVLSAKIDQGGAGAGAYERSLDRAHRVLADMSRLNIEARLAAISEGQVAQVVESIMGTIRVILERLGHDLSDPGVRAVVTEELGRASRALSGEPDTRRRGDGYRPGQRVIEA